MSPRQQKPSWHEIRGRRAKADALVAEISRMAAELRVSPSLMLNAVAHWGRREWAQCALQIGKSAPSDHTITNVLAVMSRAALLDALASDTEPMLSHERDTRPEERP